MAVRWSIAGKCYMATRFFVSQGDKADMRLLCPVCAVGLLFLLAALPPAPAQVQQPLATFSGPVQEIDGKAITLQDTDSNALRFVCTRKTRYYDGKKKISASDIKPGDRVSIETKRFPDGELEAINVRLEHPKSP